MAKVEIRCPSCNKRGNIEIAEDIINQSARGVTAINIPKEQICSHSFIAYIDKNLAVRDCFMADFQLELPEMQMEATAEKEIPDTDVADVDLIKINVPALTLTYFIRACLLKKSIVFLYEEEFLHGHLATFFEFIFRNSYDTNIEILTVDNYKQNKKKYKKYLVFGSNEVIIDKEKVLDPKKIKFERTIISKFLAEYNPKSSLIILKNEIQMSYELSKEIINMMETYEGNEKLGKKRLIDKLSENMGLKVTFSYLEFLLEITKNYFNFDLSVLSDYYFPAFGI